MRKNIFNIVNEAVELEVGPDANGKTSLFSREDSIRSGVSHNKLAAPVVQQQWKKVDSRTRPELFKTGQEAFNKAKKFGILDKISKDMDTNTADFEIDPVTDRLTINFDNGGSIDAGSLSESREPLNRRTKLNEGFVVGENNDEMWFDQDAFSSFISNSLEINKEDVGGFDVCKEPWFDHDTCDYYTPVLSEEDLDNFVRDNLDTSMFGPDFEISHVKLDGKTLTVEVLPGSGIEEDELDSLYVGPFHCVDFKHSKYADYLIFEPADDVVIDSNSVER